MPNVACCADTTMRAKTFLPGHHGRSYLVNQGEMNTVGSWLYRYRMTRRLTQEDLAEAANIHVTYVSQIELGKKTPSRKVIEAIAVAVTPEGLDGEAKEAEYRHILNAGLKLAGLLGDESQLSTRDMARSLIREKGFDDQAFTGEEVEQIAVSVDALLEGYVAQKRRGRGELE